MSGVHVASSGSHLTSFPIVSHHLGRATSNLLLHLFAAFPTGKNSHHILGASRQASGHVGAGLLPQQIRVCPIPTLFHQIQGSAGQRVDHHCLLAPAGSTNTKTTMVIPEHGHSKILHGSQPNPCKLPLLLNCCHL